MKVISSESRSTLWAFPQPGVVATANTLGAEDMETLGKNCVFLPSGAAGTVQLSLIQQEVEICVYRQTEVQF